MAGFLRPEILVRPRSNLKEIDIGTSKGRKDCSIMLINI